MGQAKLEDGPEWSLQSRRAAIMATLGTQRSAGNSSKGLDRLIKPGLGMEGHLKESEKLASPFEIGGCDSDVAFCSSMNLVWARVSSFSRKWYSQWVLHPTFSFYLRFLV